jgi:uncharacterized protein
VHESNSLEVPTSPHFEDVVRQRMSRRGALSVLAVLGGGAAGAALTSGPVAATADRGSRFACGELRFDPLSLNTDDQVSLSAGFKHDVLISWGDPVVPGAPAFDIEAQTPASQSVQFGFNNDYLNYKPLPYGSCRSKRGLLWVNHEYTSAGMMFLGVTDDVETTDEQKLIEIEAHGASIVEVRLDREANAWSYDPSSGYNRRITGSTPMTITGPAAGNVHLQTAADPTGTTVNGMFNNCGGGDTPWGTILTTEENFDQYFANATALVADTPAKVYAQTNASTFGISAGPSSRGWESVDPRFDMTSEWNEPFRFGWIVEVDPYDVACTPKKRTALGRFKHEAAAGVKARTKQHVVYMGDDQAGQFIYKFVSTGKVSHRRERNADLLDAGTLFVATFAADGSGTWTPLTFGSGPLVAPTFEDQADVLIRTRVAAAMLKATPMDRPEDVEVSPTTGYIYASMTGTSRTVADAANPRKSDPLSDPDSSRAGHVIEIREHDDDHTGTAFNWEILLLCGNPNAAGSVDSPTQPAAANTSGRTYFAGFDESLVSPISRPDNVAFDSRGNLWITTDGMSSAPSSGGLGMNDTVYGVPTAGPERGHLKALCSGPLGAEMTGPFFTPDDKTLFVSIQHPGEDGDIATPQSTWNSVAASTGTCARNGVIAIRRSNGSRIPNGSIDGEASVVQSVDDVPTTSGLALPAFALGGLVAFRHHRMSPEHIEND